MPEFIDLTGQRFGRLLVLARDKSTNTRHSTFRCLCDCGSECVIRAGNLHSGMSRSCGCRRGNSHPNRPSVETLRRGYLKEGRTQIELAAMHGCTRTTIQNWLKQGRIRSRKPRTTAKGIAG